MLVVADTVALTFALSLRDYVARNSRQMFTAPEYFISGRN